MLTEVIAVVEAKRALLAFKAAVEPGEDGGQAGALSPRLSPFPIQFCQRIEGLK